MCAISTYHDDTRRMRNTTSLMGYDAYMYVCDIPSYMYM